jgi:division protein CdvB (Snf7/Vps24/ESCRT-III family)
MLTISEKDRVELVALRQLETAVRQMFNYTGWDDDVDEEVSAIVHKVERLLDEVTAVKNILL